MSSIPAALHPALTALDLALADTTPGGKGQAGVPATVDVACHSLHAHTVALGQALMAVCDTTLPAAELPTRAQALYRCTADAVGGYHALADAAQRDTADPAWERLLDFARDALVSIAQAMAELIHHRLHGQGYRTWAMNLATPGDRAELQCMRPQRLAYGRHIVQAAWRDMEQAEHDERHAELDAQRLALTRAEQRAADARTARKLASSIFWSQVAAAGLAVWLFG